MADPINPQQPTSIASLRRAYRELGPALSQLPPGIATSLGRFETQRINNGGQPLTQQERQNVLGAAVTGGPVTPEPEPGLLETVGNIFNPFAGRRNPIINDLSQLTSALPQLPGQLLEEVRSIPELPGAVSEAMAEGDSVLQDIGNLAMLPGLRLVPGSFVVGNALRGEDVTTPNSVEGSPEQLLRHPLFTGLDVLPLAQGAARLTPTVRGVEGVMRAAGEISEGARIQRPLTTLATKRVRDGQVVPNVAGRGIERGLERFYRTTPGRFAYDMWGKQVRELSREANAANTGLQDAINPQSRRGMESELARYAKEAEQFGIDWADRIPSDRRRDIDIGLQERPTATRESLNPTEQQYVAQLEALTNRNLEPLTATGELVPIPFKWGDEIYDAATGKRILKSRRIQQFTQDVANYRAAASGFDFDVQSTIDSLRTILDEEPFKVGENVRRLESRLYALGKAGYDTQGLLADIGKFRNRKTNFGKENLSESIARFVQEYESGMVGRTSELNPQFQRAIDRYVGRTGARFGDSQLAKINKQADRIVEKSAPARFRPMIAQETRARVQQWIDENPEYIGIPLEEAQRLADEGLFGSIPGLPKAEYRAIQRDVVKTWQQLRAAGEDPLFVHRVNPRQVDELNFPNVYERIETPSQVRKAMNDMTPAYDDAIVAVRHQAYELVKRQAQEELAATYVRLYGTTDQALREELLPQARALHQTNPKLSVQAHLENLIRRDYQAFDPTSFITWKSPRLSTFPKGVMLPKGVYRNIQRMHDTTKGPITSLTDPVMKVFRTSLLPLSPRWHLYNMVGGAVMAGARTGPSSLKYIRQAYEMVKNDRLPAEIPRGFGTVPRDVIEWDKRASFADKIGAAYQFKGGETLRRIWDGTEKARDAAGNLIDKSYQFNGFVDDFYRAITLLYGEGRALKKGASRDAALQEGIALVRKTMQNWDEMTPLERSVLRSVIPFYGWMQHILRYTMSYPFDHPIRTAVTASFVRNELDDRDQGLGDRFNSMFFLGEPDENGIVRAINTSGLNPFSDVANYFTLSGFLGNLNPIIGGILQTVGIDQSTGASQLYPNLRYDSQTGRLTADNGNLLTNLATSILPQSRLLLQLSGQNAEFRELLRRNPDAARRLLQSQLGLPIILRDVPYHEEQFKAELARMDVQSRTFNEAIRSGNYGYAQQFPQLQPSLEQLAYAQQAGALADYQPTNEPPSILDMLNPVG